MTDSSQPMDRQSTEHTESRAERPGFLKIWMTAVRLYSFPASVSAVLLGLALAKQAGCSIHWGRFLLTLVGMLCFHTGANLLNDCYDFERGLDQTVDPTRGAVVRGWMSSREALWAGLSFVAAGSLCGFVLVWLAGWVVLLLGVIGTLVALGYTTRGVCLKYSGLGDLGIFIAFGVLPVFGTYWVQIESFSWVPILWTLPVVSFTVGILHANNWGDIAIDREKGCRTVASTIGDRLSTVYYRVLVLGPFVLVAAALGLRLLFPGLKTAIPWGVAIVFLMLPAAVKLARTTRESDPEAFEILDAKTGQTQLAFSVLLTAAFFLSAYLSHK